MKEKDRKEGPETSCKRCGNNFRGRRGKRKDSQMGRERGEGMNMIEQRWDETHIENGRGRSQGKRERGPELKAKDAVGR